MARSLSLSLFDICIGSVYTVGTIKSVDAELNVAIKHTYFISPEALFNTFRFFY